MSAFAHLIPAPTPTLRQALVRAIQADAAFSALTADAYADDMVFIDAEAQQFATREELFVALERAGIDRALAAQIGRVL